ncbi:MAG TPA: hypothetical protein VG013_10590 [Gemmataceae bacterium]|nr:hypothetical protein [Gemmataceae bacterium]
MLRGGRADFLALLRRHQRQHVIIGYGQAGTGSGDCWGPRSSKGNFVTWASFGTAASTRQA